MEHDIPIAAKITTYINEGPLGKVGDVSFNNQWTPLYSSSAPAKDKEIFAAASEKRSTNLWILRFSISFLDTAYCLRTFCYSYLDSEGKIKGFA